MRDFLTILMICLVLAGGAGFAWLTQNPESSWLEEAQEWRWVGPYAQQFREAYLGPVKAALDAEAEIDEEPIILVRRAPAVQPTSEQKTEAISGKVSTAPVLLGGGESVESMLARAEKLEKQFRVETSAKPEPETSLALSRRPTLGYLKHDWYLPGQRVATGVGSGSRILYELQNLAYLPVLDVDGVWSKVVFQGEPGWIDTSWQPPYSRRKARRGIVRHRYEPSNRVDTQRLEKAKRILGLDRPNRQMGPYQLYTDVQDEELLSFLNLTANKAEDAYFARFSRLPSANPTRAIILFAREKEYLEFYGGGEIRTAGHAFMGALAMWVGERPQQVLAKTLVHEITHLTNSRALAWSLPSWLQEGLAVELGSVYMEDSVAAGRISGGVGQHDHPSLLGVNMSILQLLDLLERNELPTVEQLVQLDTQKTFLKPEIVAYSYAHSGAFIRFLLDGQDEAYREGFHNFLGKISAGFRPTPTLLFKQLDTAAEVVDQHFRVWLAEAAVRVREDLEASLPGQVLGRVH